MVPPISRRAVETPVSPHRVLVDLALELKAKGKDVISFHAGQPGFPPAREAIEELVKLLREQTFATCCYAPSKGYPRLRELIAEDIKKYGGLDLHPLKQIVVTVGGAEALNIAVLTALNPGEKLLLFSPTYSVYWGLGTIHGVQVEVCKQEIDTEFQPDPECIKEKLSDEKVKAVLFASPGNPTSRVIKEDIAKLIVDLAYEKKKWVFYDQAYRHIYYEGSHLWIQRYTGAEEVVVTIDSFSKDIAIPGFRLGYMFGPEEFIKHAGKLKGYLTISAPNISQKIAMIYLEKGIKEKYLREVIPKYRERRDAAYTALRKYLPEANVIKPRAGMYLFPDISAYLEKTGLTDVEFARKIAEEKYVVMLPGSAFHPGSNRYLRVTFVTEPPERIEEGLKRVSEVIEELEKK